MHYFSNNRRTLVPLQITGTTYTLHAPGLSRDKGFKSICNPKLTVRSFDDNANLCEFPEKLTKIGPSAASFCKTFFSNRDRVLTGHCDRRALIRNEKVPMGCYTGEYIVICLQRVGLM